MVSGVYTLEMVRLYNKLEKVDVADAVGIERSTLEMRLELKPMCM